MMPESQPASSTGLDPNVAAALAYLAGPFSGIIILITERTNRYVKFHAWQSVIGLGILGIIVALTMTLAFVSIVVSATAFRVLLMTGWGLWIGWIVLWVICLVKAFTGQRWEMPVAGGYAQRRADAI